VVAAVLPNPAQLGDRMKGNLRRPVGQGHRERRQTPSVYPYHVVDNEWSMREYGAQAVVWQTAPNPVVALELLATGAWSGVGVLGPEALPPKPFLDLVNAHGSPWGLRED
jgi:saccharopine dehydrogenase (NAD+, L-lysine-forming)